MHILLPLMLALLLSACGGGSSSVSPPPPAPPPLVAPDVTLSVEAKTLIFSWTAVPGATYYRLLENSDGHSGFTQVGNDIPSTTTTVSVPIAVHLFDFEDALYIVAACHQLGCTDSAAVSANGRAVDAIGAILWPATSNVCSFGSDIAVSDDGRTVAVADSCDQSNARGINNSRDNDLSPGSGAVHIYELEENAWIERAYIKSSNSDPGDSFGSSIAMSADGTTLAVAAWGEDSAAIEIDGDQSDNSGDNDGAIYIYGFDGSGWTQRAYLKSPNPDPAEQFGRPEAQNLRSIAMSSDGRRLAVISKASSLPYTGTVHIFQFDGTAWSHEDSIDGGFYDEINDEYPGGVFAVGVSLSADGLTLAVTSSMFDDDCCWPRASIYRLRDSEWVEEVNVESPYGGTDLGVSAPELSADGNSLFFSGYYAYAETGAVFTYRLDGENWAPEPHIEAPNKDIEDWFGFDFTLSADGQILAVGARNESSSATGLNGDQNDNSLNACAGSCGAVYVFTRNGTEWQHRTYIKSSILSLNIYRGIGGRIALSGDGSTLLVRQTSTGIYIY